MRISSDADAEAAVLTTETGRALLAEVANVIRPGVADLARWRKLAPADWVAAAVRLAEGRRRGAAKFSRAGAMWLEPVGLEQATAEPVARHKARRCAGTLVVDLCAGVGGDAIALAGVGRVLAVDADAGMGRRLLWNAEVYGVTDRLAAVRARAKAFPIPDGALVHIDPDRRARPGVGRARGLRDYAPGLEFLHSLARRTPGGAMKVSPASDFDDHFSGDGFEVELVSLGGECKEATIWYGSLATCHRRATRLPAGATWTDRDGPGELVPPAPLSGWVYAPDPALVRAGLLDGFAAAHGLGRVAEGIDLLTGPGPWASPFVSAFEVLDILPVDLKRLRRAVADRGLGPLEIKVRGLGLRPEALRAQLRPEGPNPATLLIVGGPGPARALLARRATGAD